MDLKKRNVQVFIPVVVNNREMHKHVWFYWIKMFVKSVDKVVKNFEKVLSLLW